MHSNIGNVCEEKPGKGSDLVGQQKNPIVNRGNGSKNLVNCANNVYYFVIVISGGSFAETAPFMPAIKILIQQATSMNVEF